MSITLPKWLNNSAWAGLSFIKNALPDITSSAEHLGVVADGAFSGVPITGCIGDQQSAMVGQRCFEPGQAKTTYGTGAFTLINTGETSKPSKHGLLSTVLYQLGPHAPVTYALEGSVGSCGVGLNWFANKH